PGLGWLGFDPANGVCVTERYVRVGIGLDFLDASPIRGARNGGGDETMTVAIEVKPGRVMIEE
ncbi:MAG: transglutaminase family protein, partial [Beijerinckiaceae bacterium]